MFKKFALSLLLLLIIGCGQESITTPRDVNTEPYVSDPVYGSPSYSKGKTHDLLVEELNIITSRELADGIRHISIFNENYDMNKLFKFKHIVDRNEDYDIDKNLLIIKVDSINAKDVWIDCYFQKSIPNNLRLNEKLKIEGKYVDSYRAPLPNGREGWRALFENCYLIK